MPEVPKTIGPYRILEPLGQGGMGTVYRAEQRVPFRRTVAIKVVQPGLATQEVLSRFEFERRALAAMNHSCIAKVLDAGATDGDRPYFVMELVEGLPINEYCDKHRLTIGQRLGLMQQVCEGVQHAHLKGVIHRDLKPGNVLVTREGDKSIPKILDFGLAKATNRDFLEVTLFTEQDRILGTPEYMSPEQAAGDGEVIDARTDIYSLGVMLYELLIGDLPFPTDELRRAGALEALRVIREVEPPKPSTRLSTISKQCEDLATRRRSSTVAISKALRGDLDWVVMRAMAKEPERRYESANALAMELTRYLNHEPVLAGPPSASYRARKLLRRYRTQAIALGLVMLTILGGGIASIVGFRRAAEKQRQFNQLAGVVILDRARASGRSLLAEWPINIAAVDRWLVDDPPRLRRLLPDLLKTLNHLRNLKRPNPGSTQQFEREEDGYLFRALSPLVKDIEVFERLDVAHHRHVRLTWAKFLGALVNDADYLKAWAEAKRALGQNSRYADAPITNLPTQLGLWPLGENPVTGYWEFYHLRSAWDGKSAPSEIRLPTHDVDGRIRMSDSTGITFVLVPGGTAWIGAQKEDETGPNYEAAANPDEAPTRIKFTPFFLARHELTKGQWKRLAGPGIEAEPSVHRPGSRLKGTPSAIRWTHPVEHVSWIMSTELLQRHGLTLPTEAQWEYACRAGSSTPWSTGATVDTLQDYANIADQTAGKHFDWNFEASLDDGWAPVSWPVGTGKHNSFGLFDMHGNVREFCLDPYVPLKESRPGDGFHGPSGVPKKAVCRGGCHYDTSHICRSAFRGTPRPDRRDPRLGVRAARPVYR